ncbi:MAG: ATP-binding protein [Candidatus Moraniibacteriota bacterium]|nr:MAG: ATP-binding protein [Candidatus Moranbacteria bacterium]
MATETILRLPIAVIGIGIPGSGKTTLLEPFSRQNHYIYICPDNVREELTGSSKDQSQNPLVWRMCFQGVAASLQRGISFVFDATFTLPEQRERIISLSRESGVKTIIGVYFNTLLETALNRNAKRDRVVEESVLKKMHYNLQEFPPKREEGFDVLLTEKEFIKVNWNY